MAFVWDTLYCAFWWHGYEAGQARRPKPSALISAGVARLGRYVFIREESGAAPGAQLTHCPSHDIVDVRLVSRYTALLRTAYISWWIRVEIYIREGVGESGTERVKV